VGLFDKLFGEFVDVIEWTDSSNDTLVYRFERYGNEIKYGAKLTVRASQAAVFVNEGKVADVFDPGMYELKTNNLPILSTLQAWPHGFESPFKAEVYFFNTRQFTDQKWGTKNPVMLRDPEFGPVRLRAFGTYSIRINEPMTFLTEIVGTDGHFRTEDITNQLRNLIVSRFATVIGQSGIPVLDLAANYEALGTYITNKIRPEFLAYGLDVNNLLVENISLPPVVEQALDKRTSMGVIGNLRDYATYQAAEAMTTAAANPSGGAGEGVGLGIGFAMANRMAESMGQREQASSPPPPLPETPAPRSVQYFTSRDGHPQGPIDFDRLVEHVKSREVGRDALVWSKELVEWTPAGQVPELAEAFATMPPPLPGA